MIAILMMNITVMYVFLPVASRFARMPSQINKTIDIIANRGIAIANSSKKISIINQMDNLPMII